MKKVIKGTNLETMGTDTLMLDPVIVPESYDVPTTAAVAAGITEAVGGASDALQEQIDDIAEKAGSGYTPKGPASVATLNGLTGQENGWLYTMTDAGTLTDGSLAVVAGDTVAWDEAHSVWYPAMNYASKSSVDKLSVSVNELYALTETSKNTPSWTTGSYVKGDGTIGSNVALQMSNEISLAKGTAIEFYGRGASSAGSVSMISKKENGNYIPLVLNTGDSLSRYRYVNTSDESMTIVISCKLLDAPDNYLLQDSTTETVADFFELVFEPSITALSKAIDFKYVNSVGSVASNPNFNISQQFTLKPNHSLIVNIGSGSTAGAVAVLSKYDNGNYVPLVLNTGNAANKYSYKNKTEDDILVCVSFLNSDADKNVYIYLGDDVEEKISLPSLSTYSTLAVIGDSYASGELWKDNVNKGDFYPISWPQVIARMCGITATNYTKGGASTRSFIADTTERGYAQMMSDAAKDIYFVVLGLNDSSSLGLEYLGTESDIGTEADTFYGNYSKIVEGIQTHAPDAKIVLFTTPFTGATYNRDAFNEAIDNIATHYALPCIRLYEDGFFKSSPMFESRPGGHPTIVGYSGMAEAIKRLVEERMLNDMTYFNDFDS